MTRRPVDTVRMLAGIADLFAARQVATGELGRDATQVEIGIFRVLGVRQVLQGAIASRWGHRKAGVVVDILHGASMVGVAFLGTRSLRRGALAQAAVATVFTVWGATTLAMNTTKKSSTDEVE